MFPQATKLYTGIILILGFAIYTVTGIDIGLPIIN